MSEETIVTPEVPQPPYEDENGKTWLYNPATKKWDIPAPAAPEPELRYEYQPTDEQGRPLGGKQVILYRTPDELAQKLSEQNTQLVRKLREVTRKQKLGIRDDQVPADAARFEEIVEFKPDESQKR